MPKADKSAIRVLLVDDDEDDYILTRNRLAEATRGSYHLDWKTTFAEGLEGICNNKYDIILLDYSLGDRTGLDLLNEARSRNCTTPIILLTGLTELDIDLAAMHSGAADYIEKSRIDSTVLERAIRYSIQQKQIENELEKRVKARTEELHEANVALREAAARKDEFLVTLAHELRNPLAPIRNALEILKFTADEPERVASVRGIMERQVVHLVRLINDLLDVTRINRGKLQLHLERIAVSEVLEIAVEQSMPLLDKAGQTMELTIPTEPIWLNGDRVRLTQVFANLLNNAAKYSESGGKVHLSAAKKQRQVNIRVVDNGLGIPAEMLPRIFEPFTQVARDSDLSQGGLGIGLYLVKTLIEMHDGRVGARSDGAGHGTEFLVVLPCEG